MILRVTNYFLSHEEHKHDLQLFVEEFLSFTFFQGALYSNCIIYNMSKGGQNGEGLFYYDEFK